MEKLRVGVVGVGYLGRFHALIYARMPQVELVGVADVEAAVARRVARECTCAAFADGQALLGRVDAVSVAVPTVRHLAVTRPFLENGVHVLLEKPIAEDQGQAEAIVRLSEQRGAVLQIGHLERFNAGVMALAERIRDPRFIEVHRMGEFAGRGTDVDVVADLMIHDIDILLSLVPAPIARIAAAGSPVLTDKVDIANARLEFANGAVANVTASRVSQKKMRRIRVFQEDSYNALDFIEQRLDTVRKRAVPGKPWPEIVKESAPVQPVAPLDAELADFVRAVRDGTAPVVDGQAGLRALRVALQVQEKIEQARVPAG